MRVSLCYRLSNQMQMDERGQDGKEKKRTKGGKKRGKGGMGRNKKEGGGWVWVSRGAWILRRLGPHTDNAKST